MRALFLFLALASAAAAWPETAAPRVLRAALEADGERAAVVMRFSTEPRVTCTADDRARTLVVDFQPARPPAAQLFTAHELVEAAGVEPLPDGCRVVLKVRRDTAVNVLRSAPDASGFTCAIVVADEIGDLGPGGQALTWPIRGRVSSKFGMRMHPILHEERMHKGIDIAVPHGTPVRAMRGGTVKFAGWNGASGLCVVLDHGNGLETTYKHCSKLRVTAGGRVKRHQIIGEAGSTGMSTGSHVHFMVTDHGKQVDPARLMRKR